MLAWTKQINAEGNADSGIIIRWSQSHTTSNINKYESKRYEAQQNYRIGAVGTGGGGGLKLVLRVQHLSVSEVVQEM